jgi:DUF1680 family protein
MRSTVAIALLLPVLGTILLALDRRAFGQDERDAASPVVADAIRPLAPSRVELGGILGERFAASWRRRLLAIDEDELLSGFEHRPGVQTWIGEHVGKWMHAAVLAQVATGDAELADKLERVRERLCMTQEEDGYLGTYLKEKRFGLEQGSDWDVWVHKYVLLGLIANWRWREDVLSLMAARRAGDLLCETFVGEGKTDLVAAGTHVGMAATSLLEPMVLLYRTTGEARYLGFCHAIVERLRAEVGPRLIPDFLAKKPAHAVANGKAYEMMSNLIGLVEFHRQTGKADVLDAVKNAWEDIATNRLYPTGTASSGEYFREDGVFPLGEEGHVGETCVTVTWLQLNAQLHALTGEAKYADAIENTVFNHLLAAQHPVGGDWCYFTPLEGVKEFLSDINCCHSSGPRGIAMLPSLAAHETADGIAIDLLVPMTIRAKRDGRDVILTCSIEAGEDARLRIEVGVEEPTELTIRIRRPSWITGSIEVAGARSNEVGEGSEFVVSRRFENGDSIRLRLSTPLRAIDGADFGHPGTRAYAAGPWLLAFEPGARGVTQDPIPVLGCDARGLPTGEIQAAFAGPEGTTSERRRVTPLPFALAGADGGAFSVFLPGD